MKVDAAIRHGTVVDPATGRHEVADILVAAGKIVDADSSIQAEFEFDASGMYVFPGLIDYHLHIFPKSTEIGIHADTALLSQGVTAAVDAGSAGTSNFAGFIEQVVQRNEMRIWAYLNLCPAGLVTSQYHEDVNPKTWDRAAVRRLFSSCPNLLKGLKIRISRPIVHELGLGVLEEAVGFAAELDVRLAVHVTDPPGDMDTVAGMLRAGDILALLPRDGGDHA